MMSSWPIGVRLFIVGTPLALCFVSLLFSLYISRYHLDKMVERLSKSKHAFFWSSVLKSQGHAGRVLQVAQICGTVLWSGPGIRAGVLDADEIRDFPPHLKRLLVAKAALMALTFFWLLITYALIKLDT